MKKLLLVALVAVLVMAAVPQDTAYAWPSCGTYTVTTTRNYSDSDAKIDVDRLRNWPTIQAWGYNGWEITNITAFADHGYKDSQNYPDGTTYAVNDVWMYYARSVKVTFEKDCPPPVVEASVDIVTSCNLDGSWNYTGTLDFSPDWDNDGDSTTKMEFHYLGNLNRNNIPASTTVVGSGVFVEWLRHGQVVADASAGFRIEAPDCYQTCDAETPFVEVGREYDPWGPWEYDINTDQMIRVRTYRVFLESYDLRDPSIRPPCDERTSHNSEQQVRKPDEDFYFYSEEDCFTWVVYRVDIHEGTGETTTIDSEGTWTDPLVDESFKHESGLNVVEPQDCFKITEDISYEADCDGWAVYELTLVDGEIHASELIASGEWKDIYTQESVKVLLPNEQTAEFFEPAECTQCRQDPIGEMFTLIGPNGEIGYLASYQINPNTGRYAIPNVGAQKQCLGFVAVAAPHGEIIYRDCKGEVNIVCYMCTGGAYGQGVFDAYYRDYR